MPERWDRPAMEEWREKQGTEAVNKQRGTHPTKEGAEQGLDGRRKWLSDPPPRVSPGGDLPSSLLQEGDGLGDPEVPVTEKLNQGLPTGDGM